jgi:hypothetical protein
MWMLIGLLGRVASQHVVDELEETLEALWSQLEHMFASVGLGSDGTGVLHEILQRGRTTGMRRPKETPAQPHFTTARTGSMTAATLTATTTRRA